MSRLIFDRGTSTVTRNGQTIVLLPKEYALLEYLHDHEGQALSREQLLDAVWQLESPVDRTVDDHVYRLRKKLASWSPAVKIATVRGRGYLFEIKSSRLKDNPLQHMPSFSEDMKGIASAYIKYGRGDALLTLLRHKDVLGFEMEPSFQLFLRLMEGDLRFLVEEDRHSFEERAFMLLLLYQFIDPLENRRYVESAIRHQTLPPIWQNELEAMLLIPMLMDWGEYEAAKEKLDALKAEVERNNWEGLVPYCSNLTLEYDLLTGQEEALHAHLKTAEELLQHYPYMREEGQFYILKGIAFHETDPKEGARLIEQGMEVLKRTHFLPHLLNGMDTVICFSRRRGWEAMHKRYKKEWDRLSQQIGLEEIKPQIREQLRTNLESL